MESDPTRPPYPQGSNVSRVSSTMFKIDYKKEPELPINYVERLEHAFSPRGARKIIYINDNPLHYVRRPCPRTSDVEGVIDHYNLCHIVYSTPSIPGVPLVQEAAIAFSRQPDQPAAFENLDNCVGTSRGRPENDKSTNILPGDENINSQVQHLTRGTSIPGEPQVPEPDVGLTGQSEQHDVYENAENCVGTSRGWPKHKKSTNFPVDDENIEKRHDKNVKRRSLIAEQPLVPEPLTGQSEQHDVFENVENCVGTSRGRPKNKKSTNFPVDDENIEKRHDKNVKRRSLIAEQPLVPEPLTGQSEQHDVFENVENCVGPSRGRRKKKTKWTDFLVDDENVDNGLDKNETRSRRSKKRKYELIALNEIDVEKNRSRSPKKQRKEKISTKDSVDQGGVHYTRRHRSSKKQRRGQIDSVDENEIVVKDRRRSPKKLKKDKSFIAINQKDKAKIKHRSSKKHRSDSVDEPELRTRRHDSSERQMVEQTNFVDEDPGGNLKVNKTRKSSRISKYAAASVDISALVELTASKKPQTNILQTPKRRGRPPRAAVVKDSSDPYTSHSHRQSKRRKRSRSHRSMSPPFVVNPATSTKVVIARSAREHVPKRAKRAVIENILAPSANFTAFDDSDSPEPEEIEFQDTLKKYALQCLIGKRPNIQAYTTTSDREKRRDKTKSVVKGMESEISIDPSTEDLTHFAPDNCGSNVGLNASSEVKSVKVSTDNDAAHNTNRQDCIAEMLSEVSKSTAHTSVPPGTASEISPRKSMRLKRAKKIASANVAPGIGESAQQPTCDSLQSLLGDITKDLNGDSIISLALDNDANLNSGRESVSKNDEDILSVQKKSKPVGDIKNKERDVTVGKLVPVPDENVTSIKANLPETDIVKARGGLRLGLSRKAHLLRSTVFSDNFTSIQTKKDEGTRIVVGEAKQSSKKHSSIANHDDLVNDIVLQLEDSSSLPQTESTDKECNVLRQVVSAKIENVETKRRGRSRKPVLGVPREQPHLESVELSQEQVASIEESLGKLVGLETKPSEFVHHADICDTGIREVNAGRSRRHAFAKLNEDALLQTECNAEISSIPSNTMCREFPEGSKTYKSTINTLVSIKPQAVRTDVTEVKRATRMGQEKETVCEVVSDENVIESDDLPIALEEQVIDEAPPVLVGFDSIEIEEGDEIPMPEITKVLAGDGAVESQREPVRLDEQIQQMEVHIDASGGYVQRKSSASKHNLIKTDKILGAKPKSIEISDEKVLSPIIVEKGSNLKISDAEKKNNRFLLVLVDKLKSVDKHKFESPSMRSSEDRSPPKVPEKGLVKPENMSKYKLTKEKEKVSITSSKISKKHSQDLSNSSQSKKIRKDRAELEGVKSSLKGEKHSNSHTSSNLHKNRRDKEGKHSDKDVRHHRDTYAISNIEVTKPPSSQHLEKKHASKSVTKHEGKIDVKKSQNAIGENTTDLVPKEKRKGGHVKYSAKNTGDGKKAQDGVGSQPSGKPKSETVLNKSTSEGAVPQTSNISVASNQTKTPDIKKSQNAIGENTTDLVPKEKRKGGHVKYSAKNTGDGKKAQDGVGSQPSGKPKSETVLNKSTSEGAVPQTSNISVASNQAKTPDIKKSQNAIGENTTDLVPKEKRKGGHVKYSAKNTGDGKKAQDGVGCSGKPKSETVLNKSTSESAVPQTNSISLTSNQSKTEPPVTIEKEKKKAELGLVPQRLKSIDEKSLTPKLGVTAKSHREWPPGSPPSPDKKPTRIVQCVDMFSGLAKTPVRSKDKKDSKEKQKRPHVIVNSLFAPDTPWTARPGAPSRSVSNIFILAVNSGTSAAAREGEQTAKTHKPRLQPGWKRVVGTRCSGATQGKRYVVFYSPNGKRLASKRQLQEYLLSNNLLHLAESFSFSILEDGSKIKLNSPTRSKPNPKEKNDSHSPLGKRWSLGSTSNNTAGSIATKIDDVRKGEWKKQTSLKKHDLSPLKGQAGLASPTKSSKASAQSPSKPSTANTKNSSVNSPTDLNQASLVRKDGILYVDPRLPEGWSREIRRQQCGRIEVYVVSPDGKKFRRRHNLEQYLTQNNQPYTVDDFDLSVMGRFSHNDTNLLPLKTSKDKSVNATSLKRKRSNLKIKKPVNVKLMDGSAKKVKIVKPIIEQEERENAVIEETTDIVKEDSAPMTREEAYEFYSRINCGMSPTLNDGSDGSPVAKCDGSNLSLSPLPSVGTFETVRGLVLSANLLNARSERRLSFGVKGLNCSISKVEEAEEGIPVDWVKSLASCRPGMSPLEIDAATSIAAATESFMRSLACTALEKGGGTELTYGDLASAVADTPSLKPLSTIIPQKISFRQFRLSNRPTKYFSFKV